MTHYPETRVQQDGATRHAVENLKVWIDRWREENGGKGVTPPVIVAAEHLLRTLDPAAIEDREYHSYDLQLPEVRRCGAEYPLWGRTCSRRLGHINESHRDGEISWTDERAAQ